MGWTTTYKPKGEGIIEFLKRKCIDCTNEHGTWELLKGKVIKQVAYMAIRRTFTDGTAPLVFAGVFKIQLMPKADYNFGYKDMDETVMPYYFDCPADILDMLTETDYPNAVEWRQKCRDRIAASSAVKLTKGALVEFKEEVRFSNDFAAKLFEVVDARRNSVWAIGKNGEVTHRNLRIRNLRDYLVRGDAMIATAKVLFTKELSHG